MQEYLALVVLASFVHGGNFPKLSSSEVLEWVFRPLLRFVEVQDLFLWRYFLLHPKFLHEAPVERLGAIFGSLCTVRCRYMVIFRVLG